MEENSLLVDTVNQVTAEDRHASDSIEGLIEKVGKKFIENQLAMFPAYCYEARKENFIQKRLMEEAGNPGGWSEDKSFKFDYVIPRGLYLFMTNLVYKDFWAESNEKIWRKFMKHIMQGADPDELLKAIKLYYGSSQAMKEAGQL